MHADGPLMADSVWEWTTWVDGWRVVERQSNRNRLAL